MNVKTEVEISWSGDGGAELLSWVDNSERIPPATKADFKAKLSPLQFSYDGEDAEDHIFEWILLFPELTLKDLRARVRFGAGEWHSLDRHPGERQHSWTSFGVAP